MEKFFNHLMLKAPKKKPFSPIQAGLPKQK